MIQRIQHPADQFRDLLQARLLRRAEPGPIPRLPADMVLGLDGEEILAPWTDLTPKLSVDYLNAVSQAVPADQVPSFQQINIRQGRAGMGVLADNINVLDLDRPIPLFGTPSVGIRVYDRGPVVTGMLRGGGEHWIQQSVGRNEPGGPLPDQRAGAITEYVTINFSDVVRLLALQSDCVQDVPGHALSECRYPSLTRIGNPATERYSYALNGMANPAGLPPGSQVDISILIRADRYTGVDWLFERDPRPSPVSSLEVDGIFVGAGIIKNQPVEWPADEASVFAVAAGPETSVLGEALEGEQGSSIANGGHASMRMSGSLRTLHPYPSTRMHGRHEGEGGAAGPRSLLDGLQAAGVPENLLRQALDRQTTREDFLAGWRPDGPYYRFTLSVITLPLDAWPLPVADQLAKYRFSVRASVRYWAFNEGLGRRMIRTYNFIPAPTLRAGFDQQRPGGAVVSGAHDLAKAVHWETRAGEFGLVVGGFSHATRSGSRLRFTLENVSARHFVRAPPNPRDPRVDLTYFYQRPNSFSRF